MESRKKQHLFERLAGAVTHFAGSTPALIAAIGIILIWSVTGPLFGYSDSWQLVINTGTTVVTFLMVFLIQRSQNKDSRAVHLKLNELVASLKGPSNRLVDVEHLTEAELRTLGRYYTRIAAMASREKDLSASHSIEEAEQLHHAKYAKARSAHTGAGNGQ
jgi:low affinity Fe/Cu permease